MSRLYPATSAARIAASRRSARSLAKADLQNARSGFYGLSTTGASTKDPNEPTVFAGAALGPLPVMCCFADAGPSRTMPGTPGRRTKTAKERNRGRGNENGAEPLPSYGDLRIARGV